MSATPSRRTRVLLAVAAAVVLALLAAALLGSGRSAAGTTAAAAPADGSAAVGFSRDMSIHHQQAVEMSFLVLRSGTSPSVRTLAYDIANTQAGQRGMMLGWLSLWGRTATSGRPPMAWMNMPPPSARERRQGVLMPGMAGRGDMAALGEAEGKRADVLFLRLMTEHHRGGVHMARGVLGKGAPVAVERLARAMADGQQAEIELMESLLRDPDG